MWPTLRDAYLLDMLESTDCGGRRQSQRTKYSKMNKPFRPNNLSTSSIPREDLKSIPFTKEIRNVLVRMAPVSLKGSVAAVLLTNSRKYYYRTKPSVSMKMTGSRSSRGARWQHFTDKTRRE